jgi:hypothetical protein
MSEAVDALAERAMRELFDLEEMRRLHNNPQRQVGYIGVGSYVPLPDRERSATAVRQPVPDFLDMP